MKIGVPKEIKDLENRVALTPSSTEVLVDAGNEVYIETGAGEGSSFTDDEYRDSGATIVDTPEEVWDKKMIMKVKEPLKSEFKYLHEGMILFAYLHLAPEIELTDALLDNKVTAVAYETMEQDGELPLLNPMSQVAGRYSVQIGAHYLTRAQGGKGILLGSVPGVRRGNVVIVGGGTTGLHAAKMAYGLGSKVTVIDLNPQRLAQIEDIFNGQIDTMMSNSVNIAIAVENADLVISGVLIPGRRAPVLITEEMVKSMEPGSVIVDIAIDQGGNVETADHPTTHQDPIYIKHGIIHYAVANIPGAVPNTSTKALTNVTTLYALQIAGKNLEQAALENSTILTGINTYQGKMTNKGIAEDQDREFHDIKELLKNQ